MNKDIFEKYSVPRAVAALAIPSVCSMMISMLYNLVDTFFIGQLNDTHQVAAVSIAAPLFLIYQAVGNLFGVGASAFISRCLGKGDLETARKTGSFAIYASVLCGLLTGVLTLIFLPQLLTLLGGSGKTFDYASDYVTYMACGAIPVIASATMNNVVRGEGAAKIVMFSMVTGTVINIILDPVMIFAMGLGVSGAAIATVIGNLGNVLCYLWYFLRKNSPTQLSLSIRDFSMKWEIVKNVLVIGLPAAATSLLYSTSIVVQNQFLELYGDVYIAATGIAHKANMLVMFPQMGISTGVLALIGYCYGAKNYKRMKQTIHFSMLCTVTVGTLLTAVYHLFSRRIVSIFMDDPAVVEAGEVMLRAVCMCGPFLGIVHIVTATCQAMGRGIPSTVLTVGRQGVYLMTFMALGHWLFGLNGIIYAPTASDYTTFIIAIFIYIYLMKKLKKEETAGVQ